jgi:hypothetical protein
LLRKDDARQIEVIQLPQDELQGRSLLGVGIADHDGRITGRQRRACVFGELDRSRAINEGEAVAHETGASHIQLHTHGVGAGFGTGIACQRLVGGLALPRDGTCTVQQRLQKRGLAA